MRSSDNLPSVVSDIPRDLRTWVDRVRETLGKLSTQQTELVNYVGGTDGVLPPGGSGDGGGTTLPCGDPAYPPAPTGLEVAAGFSGFLISWDAPTYCGHDYTEVWGLRNDDQGAALLLGSSVGRMFSHLVEEGGAYWCFWIRHVNIDGDIGPYNQTGGTCAATALDIDWVLDGLIGQITESHLYQALNGRIDLVDMKGPTYAGSVAWRVANAESSLLGRLDTIAAAFGDDAPYAAQATLTAANIYAMRKAYGLLVSVNNGASYTTCTLPVDSPTPAQVLAALTAQAAALVTAQIEGSSVRVKTLAKGATVTLRLKWANTADALLIAAGGNSGRATAAITDEWGVEASTRGLFAHKLVKMDVAGHVSGFGLTTDAPVGETPRSTFGVRADRFFIAGPSTASETAPTTNLYKGRAWYKPSTKTTSYYTGDPSATPPVAGTWSIDPKYAIVPFQVLAAPTLLEGVTIPPGVYIDGATIRRASIKWATIQFATIDWLNVIVQLKANDILAGSIAVDKCIKSGVFTSGSKGWQVCYDGNAEFNNVTIRNNVSAGNNIYGGGATGYSAGPGMFAGWDGSTYKWRVGDPLGARLVWDGSSVAVFDSSGALTLRSGRLTAGNTVPNSSYSGLPTGTAPTPFTARKPWVIETEPSAHAQAGDMALEVHPSWLPRPSSFTAMVVHKYGDSIDRVAYFTHSGQPIPVVSGGRYEVSGYTAGTDCTKSLHVFWYGAGGNYLGMGNAGNFTTVAPSEGIDAWSFKGGFVVAPAGAAFAQVAVRTNGRVSTSLSTNLSYVGRLYFAPAGSGQTTLTAWSETVPGMIGPGSASTYIADATIGRAQIAELAVDTLRLAGNAVMVTASYAASRSAFNCGKVEVITVLSRTLTISGLRSGETAGTAFMCSTTVYPVVGDTANRILVVGVFVNGTALGGSAQAVVGDGWSAGFSGYAQLGNGSHTVEMRIWVDAATVGGPTKYINACDMSAICMSAKR